MERRDGWHADTDYAMFNLDAFQRAYPRASYDNSDKAPDLIDKRPLRQNVADIHSVEDSGGILVEPEDALGHDLLGLAGEVAFGTSRGR